MTFCRYRSPRSLQMALSQAQVFKDELPLARSCPLLNEIRLAEEIKELTIEVKDGGRLHVHRIILAARVPCLRAQLGGQLTEENSVLRWPRIPLSAAAAFMDYVYTGRVEITEANAECMVALARMMDLSNLENWGVQFMTSRLTLGNLATTWAFACSLHIASLVDNCIHMMRKQFKAIVRSDLFPCLPAETMLTLLRDDNLQVDSEEEVFQAISSWVGPGSEDLNERLKVNAPAMLKEVRWLQTSVQFRSHIMQVEDIFKRSFECTRLMALIEQWMLLDEKHKPPCPFNTNRRLAVKPAPAQTLLVVFGEEKNQDQQQRLSVFAFDSDLQMVERMADMEDRWDAKYIAVDNSIFVIGGDPKPYTRVQEFLVRERRWRERASLAVERDRGHATAAVRFAAAGGEKTLIGVFGGRFDLSASQVYDVRRDSWHRLPDLREKRYAPAAASVPGDSRMFVFGGGNFSPTHPPTPTSWHRLPDLLEERSWAAAASVPGDSRMFVFGGENGPFPLASVEYCQFGADWRERTRTASSADFWQPAAPMRTARYELAATALRGGILVAGGFAANDNYLNVVEFFSLPDANHPRGQWTEVAGLQKSGGWFTLLTSPSDTVFALDRNNTVETLTTADHPKSWVWSLKNPLETVSWIRGAGIIRL